MNKPNFLIIGAGKAATTSLWAMLREHPDVFMPVEKEIRFFDRDEVYFDLGWPWYMEHFREANSHVAVGEATPHYARVESFPETPIRIRNDLPQARIIYSVRHPLRRIESAWIQALSTAHPISRDFNKAVHEYPSLIEETRYWRNLNAYRHYFPDSQIKVVFFEDLIEDQGRVLAELFDFLGVDPHKQLSGDTEKMNPSKGKTMSSNWVRLIKKVPLLYKLLRKLPPKLKSAADEFTYTSIPKPKLDKKTRQWVIEQLKPEADAILKYTEKSSSYWNL